MPLDMMLNKIYQINYTTLYREINSLQIFNDSQIQSLYLNKWIEVLKQAENMSINDFNDSSKRKLMLKENMEAPEKFQLPVIYKSNTIYIHFRVSRILELIKISGVTESEAREVPLEDFIKDNSYINWTKTNDKVEIKEEPIIMVPFAIGKYHKILVIDGNHRITDCINSREKYIKSYEIDGDWLVQANLFTTSFDKMMYIFQNEMVAGDAV